MKVYQELLRRANAKLGESIHHFDLPAVTTCPGRTTVCEGLCYATRGRFAMPTMRKRLAWNLRQTRRKDFVPRMVREIRRKGVVVLRIHVAGDFHSPEYVRAWEEIMRRMPKVRYYFYTRSWRVPAIALALARLAALACCRMWYSVDDQTGVPESVPEGVRLAWLQTEGAPAEDAGVVFRPRRLRGESRIGLPMVCPDETPAGRAQGVNCGSCTWCWA